MKSLKKMSRAIGASQKGESGTFTRDWHSQWVCASSIMTMAS